MKNLPKTKVAIIGLGLIGGSLGLLLKQKTNCYVVGFSLHWKTLKKARKIGALDEIADSLEKAVKEADIIFVATPVSEIVKVLKKIVFLLRPGSLVTDVGSVKEEIIDQAEKIFPKNVTFIGGHPMAGKDKKGIDEASVNLLKGCFWALIPGRNTKKREIEKLKKLIKAIGAKPLVIEAKRHDRAVACVSHLPAVLSSTLCLTVSQEKDWQKIWPLAAEGFRDTSRLAANPPLLSTDFCLGNQKNIKRLIEKIISQLENFQAILEENNRTQIFNFFSKARTIRNNWFVKSRFYGNFDNKSKK